MHFLGIVHSCSKLVLSTISYTELWLLLSRGFEWRIAWFIRSCWHKFRDYVHLFPSPSIPERYVIMQYNSSKLYYDFCMNTLSYKVLKCFVLYAGVREHGSEETGGKCKAIWEVVGRRQQKAGASQIQ